MPRSRSPGCAPACVKRKNWEQLAKFCAVGATGYLVNLAVYAFLLDVVGLHYLSAAVGSFLVADATTTSGTECGPSARNAAPSRIRECGSSSSRLRPCSRTSQCSRSSSRSVLGEFVAQAIAIVLVTPVNFVGNKLWSFGPRS
jgi:hypothetical protein